MNIIQTTGGWIASEEIRESHCKTIIHKDSGTIRHISKINNELISVCTLKLEKEKFSFTFWDKFSLETRSKFSNFYRLETLSEEEARVKHLIWGTRTLRNQKFKKKPNYIYQDINKELFNLYISGEVDYNNELAQSLYRNPGLENLEKLLFRNKTNIIKNNVLEYFWDWEWDDLEAIYNCPWENKAEIFQDVALGYGRYINLFCNPEQFTNNIDKIEKRTIEDYLRMGLPRIPENLQTAPEIEEYMKNQVTEYKEPIPKYIQEIHTLLGDPIEERVRLGLNRFSLKTKEIEIYIENKLPFPILSLRREATREGEIVLCEELGMRSRNYRPSRLKRYEL